MKLQSTHSIKAILGMSKEIKILQQARKLPGIHEIFLFYFEMLLGNRDGGALFGALGSRSSFRSWVFSKNSRRA
jgi:hypothetical protein